jgi:hypothetical protein
LTAGEILELDAHCRRLGINLVPNQNSFGHLRYFLEHPRLKKLAEVSEPYEGANGDFLRYPTTLAPNNPGTLPFIRELFDELLPNFSSKSFNVGCDETWDLGRGQSKALCEKKGKGEVYFDFLTSIHREVNSRGRQMMFWGDIILHHPELIPKLPKNVVALNWGYEKNHPFEKETASFARSKIPFYVCPGTSTWMTLLGRHDNALLNLRSAAQAGGKHGAIGYLNTDWGDGGHPQPLAVSYLPYLFGAACAWCEKTADEKLLAPVLSRDIFCDPTGHAAAAAFALGLAHTKFSYFSPNATPFGAVIAAPPPEWRELFCRDGLKYYARIPAKNIIRALEEVRRQRLRLKKSRPIGAEAEVLVMELDLAARMASKSCEITLWQQGVAKKSSGSQELARKCIAELKALDADFKAYWPLRNKGTTRKCSAFLQWRINDFQKQKLFYPPEKARIAKPKTYAAE